MAMPGDVSSAESQDTIATNTDGKDEKNEQDVAEFRHCRSGLMATGKVRAES